MAGTDATGVDFDAPVGIIGLTTGGVPATPVGSDTNGNMLVKDAANGTDGSTAPTVTTQVGGKDPSGNLQTFSTDTTGAQFVSTRLALTGSAPAAVSVGVASGVVLAANASRRGLVLTNTSTGIISLNIVAGTAVLKSGITLYPGGVWVMDEYTFTTAAINGISSVAASNLAIQELT